MSVRSFHRLSSSPAFKAVHGLSLSSLSAIGLAACLSACGGGGGGGGGGTPTTSGTTAGEQSGVPISSTTSGTTSGATSGATSGTSSGTTPTESMPSVTPETVRPTSPSTTTYGNLSRAALGVNASLQGAVPFPADNAWNTNISSAPVDPNSANLIASIGVGTGLHPDFGSEKTYGGPIGIPYIVVSGSTPKVAIHFTAYGDESDPGPYPVPANAPVEGGTASDGDRHVLVLDKDNNKLYEMGNAYRNADGSWNASGGAVFDLASNALRPLYWTSADAAGLPIFPGLARYDEAVLGAGGIKHALRFTVKTTRKAFVPPARHWASSNTSVNLPPMGMRVRLKASYAIPSTFSNEAKALLTAMKTYGMIVADNGSNWFISGAPDDRWNNDRLLSELGQVKGSNFEVVRMDGLVTP